MATRIKLYFIVLFSQYFSLLLLAQFYLLKGRTKRKKIILWRARKKKRKSEILSRRAFVAFFSRVCESLYSSLRVHLGVTNPIVCLILHINHNFSGQDVVERRKIEKWEQVAWALSACFPLYSNFCSSLFSIANWVPSRIFRQ